MSAREELIRLCDQLAINVMGPGISWESLQADPARTAFIAALDKALESARQPTCDLCHGDCTRNGSRGRAEGCPLAAPTATPADKEQS